MSAVVERFVSLVKVNGESLKERTVATAVRGTLEPHGITVLEDSAAEVLKGNCGNLLCFPPHFSKEKPAILFGAHLDTVQPTTGINVSVDNGTIRTDGSTILGADNRAGLSIMTELLLTAAKDPGSWNNFFISLTVGEELGMLGAKALDLSPYNISGVYVFDSAKRPGVYIQECAGASMLTIEFKGKAAHSAVAPEEGRNAILAACRALAPLKGGRIDEESTFNIGTIKGGEATNIVPDRVIVEGEVRSFSRRRVEDEVAKLRSYLEQFKGDGITITLSDFFDFEPYEHAPDAEICVRLEEAMKKAGLTPQPVHYHGGSDANAYNVKGVPAVNIGIGAQKPHSKEEFILVEDLEISFRLALELARIHH